MPLCVCDGIVPIQNRVSLLILQHPQEQDRELGTARLTALHFANAVLKIGLSWPSLSKALGRPVADPSRWAVLYLGSAKVADLETDREIVAINRKGEIEDNQRAILKDIEGIVLLDGTWSQAKALWWRNAWMLKCQRVILAPASPSLQEVAPRAASGRPVDHRSGGDAAFQPRKTTRYRRDAARQFRADAGEIPGIPELSACAETAAEAGLSPPQAPLTRAFSSQWMAGLAPGCLCQAGRI